MYYIIYININNGLFFGQRIWWRICYVSGLGVDTHASTRIYRPQHTYLTSRTLSYVPLNLNKCPCEAEAGSKCARCMDADVRVWFL